jgi:hypothetical protein
MSYPKSRSLKNHDQIVDLIIPGQGVFEFSNKNTTTSCTFSFINESDNDGIKVSFTKDKIIVKRCSTDEEYIDPKNSSGLIDKKGSYYWFSLDAQNQRLCGGYGEARFENIKYIYILPHKEKLTLESFSKVKLNKPELHLVPLKLLRDPIIRPTSLLIKNTDQLAMIDIAGYKYIPKAGLSSVGQKLYDCVSGSNFKLNDDKFPDFGKAIEYSIKTPGCWCHEKLKEKSTEFNPDKPNLNETYLRITLGKNSGESPGIPYVMEIWPVGHFSPIHNHSSANAIIKVLRGSINVKMFPFLCEDKEGITPHTIVNLNKGDITWISPTLNQTHQLTNLPNNKKTCVTIQCYMYDDNDTSHYDYFDYINEDGNKQQYEPDSDMDYLEFRFLMKAEWANKKWFK